MQDVNNNGFIYYPESRWCKTFEVSLEDPKKDMDKFKEAIKSFLVKVVIKTISNTQFKNIKFIPN